MKENNDIDTNDRRLEFIFGEALGTTPSREETEDAWQAFVSTKQQKRISHSHKIYFTVAAIAAILIIALLVWKFPVTQVISSEEQVYASLNVPQEVTTVIEGNKTIVTTPPATTTTLYLSDGTEVMLNANSRLEYSTSFEKDRCVKLMGEAQFNVVKDEYRPFVVYAEDLRTTVLGTVFNVKAYPNSFSSVSLYKGSVRVDVGKEKSVVLAPGEELSLTGKDKIELNLLSEGVNGWTCNEFIFDNKDLRSVMQEIGSWYNMDIIFNSRTLLDERVYVKISREMSCDEVLEILCDLKIAEFYIENDKIRVKKSKS